LEEWVDWKDKLREKRRERGENYEEG